MPEVKNHPMNRLPKISQLFDSVSLPGSGYLVDFPVLYVNLDRSKERNEFMIAQQEHLGISEVFERVTAIDGAGVDGDIDFPYEIANKFNASEAACTLSHLSAIQRAWDEGWERVLILEDDASFELFPYLGRSLNEYLDAIPEDWEFLSLHHSGERVAFEAPDTFDDPESLVFKQQCWSCVAYVVNRSGMKKALRDRSSEGTIPWGQADYFVYDQCVKYTLKLPVILDRDKASSDLNSTLRPPQADYVVAKRVMGFYKDQISRPMIEKVFIVGHQHTRKKLESLGNIQHEFIKGGGSPLHHYAIWQEIVAHEEKEQKRINQIPFLQESRFAIHHDRDLFLVLYEDVEVPVDFLCRFGDMAQALTFDFDMIYLGQDEDGQTVAETTSPEFVRVEFFPSIHAYMLTMRGARKLIKNSFLNGFSSMEECLTTAGSQDLLAFAAVPGLVSVK